MNLFTKPTTVDGVLEAFRTTIANLEAVAVSNSAQADDHAAAMATLAIRKQQAEQEAARATSIADKMKAVFE